MRFTFADYLLSESITSKKLVFSFGRFQPPTIGHKLLIDKVVNKAKSIKADHVIYASKTQDAKSNPLSVDVKVKFLRKMFPGVHFEPANDEVRTFIEALKKFYKQGYQEVYMIAGSDRVPEYTKLFNKYNGGEDFSFNVLKVLSAGERDPDAEGASGMSGTKMRQAAFDNNFAAFRTGIPSSLSDEDTKKLMSLIKKTRTIKEFLEYDTSSFLGEGVNDKGIFKAVFLAGGPGSGKDYVLKKTLDGHGLIEINSDKALEYLMDKYNLDKKMPDSEEQQRNAIRARAKSVTELRQRLALHGRNGVIINGTGDDPGKIAAIKTRLEGLGYDTKLLLVNTKNEVSQQRNIQRGEQGGRTVPENIRLQKWTAVQDAKEDLRDMFGSEHYHEFDNSEDLRTAGPDIQQQKEAEMLDLFKTFRKFTETAPESEESQQWINNQKQMAKSLAANPPPEETQEPTKPSAVEPTAAQPTQAAASQTQNVAVQPTTAATPSQPANNQPASDAMEKARRMGLEYYGFGRFGKKGHTTHKEVDGDLKALDPVHEQFKGVKTPLEIAQKHGVELEKIMIQLKKGIKVEKEHTSSAKLARKIALQHLAEIPDYYDRLSKVESGKKLNEAYELSDKSSKNLLTLGYSVVQPKPEFSSYCERITEQFIKKKRLKDESYDSPSAESPSVFGHAKDDWKNGKTSVSELTGDTELSTITFQKDDELKKRGLEPFSTFKSKNVTS